MEEPVYAVTIMSVKLSILLFYLRLFSLRWFHFTVYVSMAIIVGNYIPSAILSAISSIPPAQTWDVTITGEKCINKLAFHVAGEAINVLSDVVIFFCHYLWFGITYDTFYD